MPASRLRRAAVTVVAAAALSATGVAVPATASASAAIDACGSYYTQYKNYDAKADSALVAYRATHQKKYLQQSKNYRAQADAALYLYDVCRSR